MDHQTRLFPFYDGSSSEVLVEFREKGRYQLEVKADRHKTQVIKLDSYQLIRENNFRKTIELEIL